MVVAELLQHAVAPRVARRRAQDLYKKLTACQGLEMVKFHNDWDNAVEALKAQNICPSDSELLINYLDLIPKSSPGPRLGLKNSEE